MELVRVALRALMVPDAAHRLQLKALCNTAVEAGPEIVWIEHKKPGGKVVRTRQRAVDWDKGVFVAVAAAAAAAQQPAQPAAQPLQGDAPAAHDQAALPFVKTEVKGKMMFDGELGEEMQLLCMQANSHASAPDSDEEPDLDDPDDDLDI